MAAAGGQVLVEVMAKGGQDRVVMRGAVEALPEPADRPAQGVDALARSVVRAPLRAPLASVKSLQFPGRFMAHGFDLGRVIHKRLQLALAPAQSAGRVGLIEAEIPLLKHRVAARGDFLPGDRVRQVEFVGRVFVFGPGFHGQGQPVNGLRWGMQKQEGDVIDSVFVSEDCSFAMVNEVPVSDPFSEEVAGSLVG